MTEKEIIRALRLCSCETSTRNCPTCPLSGNDDCVTDALREAADIIERLTAENVVLPDGQASAIESLRKEIEWKDMVIALAQKEQAKAEAERDALREKQRWIPVTERMPNTIPCNAGTEYSEAVIVWTTGNKAMIAVWDGIDFICPTDFWEAWGEEITHWMPLPEAPEEGEKA